MELVVLKQDSGAKIERLLSNRLNLPKNLIYKLLREKKIALFRKNIRMRIDLGFTLECNDHIKIFANLFHKEYDKNNGNENSQVFLEKQTIWTFDDFLIINKPKGLASQLGSGIVMAVDSLVKPYYIVHRLDKQTSGLMIIAKTTAKARWFGKLFQNQQIEKYYICYLDGQLKESTWVDKPILKIDHRCIIDEKGKPAKTLFIPVEYDENKNTTLAIAKIIHGRTHQVRLHAQTLGLPLVGDVIYNPRENTQNSDFFLCAYSLKFNNNIFNMHLENINCQLINSLIGKN